jgi:hypothetical protein
VDSNTDASSIILGPIPVTEVAAPHRNKTIGIIKTTSDVVPSCGGARMKLKKDYHIKEHAPYVDFHHYTGAHKPWLAWQRPSNITQRLKKVTDHMKITDTHVWWYYWLNRVKEDLKVDIEIENFNAERPVLGAIIPKTFMMDYVDKHREIMAKESA